MHAKRRGCASSCGPLNAHRTSQESNIKIFTSICKTHSAATIALRTPSPRGCLIDVRGSAGVKVASSKSTTQSTADYNISVLEGLRDAIDIALQSSHVAAALSTPRAEHRSIMHRTFAQYQALTTVTVVA